MKKPEVVKQVAGITNMNQGDVNRVIKSLIKVIQEAMVKGEVISLSGLGSFRAKPRKARQARNLKTKEIIPVPAGRKISFKPTATLRKMINK